MIFISAENRIKSGVRLVFDPKYLLDRDTPSQKTVEPLYKIKRQYPVKIKMSIHLLCMYPRIGAPGPHDLDFLSEDLCEGIFHRFLHTDLFRLALKPKVGRSVVGKPHEITVIVCIFVFSFDVQKYELFNFQLMKKILLLSDTHSYMDSRILSYAKEADEVWHCGDFGSLEVIEKLEQIRPLRGVYGNIDDAKIRKEFPEVLRFQCEKVDVLMIHIGGYPGRYTQLTKEEIEKKAPKLFISGHSHILKVMMDKKRGILHMNPGAAGKVGWHKVRTMLRFKIDGSDIKDLEVIELGPK